MAKQSCIAVLPLFLFLFNRKFRGFLSKPGVNSVQAYEASIQAIKDTGYMKYNYVGIGHGVGLFVHEPPFLGANGKYELMQDNIITVEPGIYIPGWGGIRIEDQVLITEFGCENLISTTKELIEL